MKIKLFVFVLVLSVIILFNPYVYKNYVKPIVFSSEDIKQTEMKFEYRPDMYIGKYMEGIIMYDGIRLINIDEKGKEIFSSTIRSDNFYVDTSSDFIYILDRVNKRIHKINSRGEVIGDIRTDKTVVSINSFKDGRLIIQYSTDVKAEGIQIFDKDGNLVKDIAYPKSSINIIKEDENSGGFIVSALKREESLMANSLYYYNHKMDPVYANEVENSIFLDIEMKASKLFLMDVDFISIRDKNFQEVKRLSAENTFLGINATDKEITLLDGKRKIKNMDIEGNLIEELNFKDDIIVLERLNDELIIASRNEIFFNKEIMEFSRDIIRVLPMKNHIAVFFRGAVKFIEI